MNQGLKGKARGYVCLGNGEEVEDKAGDSLGQTGCGEDREHFCLGWRARSGVRALPEWAHSGVKVGDGTREAEGGFQKGRIKR